MAALECFQELRQKGPPHTGVGKNFAGFVLTNGNKNDVLVGGLLKSRSDGEFVPEARRQNAVIPDSDGRACFIPLNAFNETVNGEQGDEGQEVRNDNG